MKLILDIINKKMELYEFCMLKKFYSKAIWNFYVCYNLSIAILNISIDKKDIIMRNMMWERILSRNKKLEDNEFIKIKKIINKDMRIVIQAIKTLQKINEDTPYELGSIDKPDYIGMLSYEFQGLK